MKWLLSTLVTAGKGKPLLRYWRVFLAISFAMTMTAGGASIYLALRAFDVDQQLHHASTVWREVELLLGDMLDAETGERGFLLTGKARYLDPYSKGAAAAPGALAALQGLLSADPVQHAHLAVLTRLVDAELDELRGIIMLQNAGRRDAALQTTETDRGKTLMDRIRRELDVISTSEFQTLRQERAERRSLRSELLVLISGNLLLAMLIVGYLAHATYDAVAVIRERTKRLEREIQLRRSTEDTLRQVQKLEAIGQLSGGIAHDFNNLLTIIIGNLDTVQRRLTQSPDLAHAAELAAIPIEHALKGARSAAQLTHRLLAFSRRQMLAPVPLDLNRLVASMSELLRRTLGETIEIETVLAAGLWPANIDPNQMESALINLCLNARDAMPDGGKLTIETATTFLDERYAAQFGDIAPGQYVMLGVTDTGCGIPPELLERIFEPFFTTKKEGEGSGLGLAMVHGFVKQSGGHIRIYSEPGHGTTVKVYLPRLMQAGAPAVPAARAGDVAPAPCARPYETVLLVEDNDGVRSFITSALQELNYVVLEAADAAEALRILESGARADLLLTDIVLPGMSGRELAEEVRVMRRGISVLFMTGYTRNAIIHHGRLDPDVHLLNKPFTQQALARKARETLDSGRPTDGTPGEGK